MTKFMIVEHFKDGCFDRVYERFKQHGRMLPDGLVYLDSWRSQEDMVCFQLMETDDESLFSEWISVWEDLVEFEIFPID